MRSVSDASEMRVLCPCNKYDADDVTHALLTCKLVYLKLTIDRKRRAHKSASPYVEHHIYIYAPKQNHQ